MIPSKQDKSLIVLLEDKDKDSKDETKGMPDDDATWHGGGAASSEGSRHAYSDDSDDGASERSVRCGTVLPIENFLGTPCRVGPTPRSPRYPAAHTRARFSTAANELQSFDASPYASRAAGYASPAASYASAEAVRYNSFALILVWLEAIHAGCDLN
ncbi:hypothetical protein C8R44DRAFT_864368 [Mycena epipterygia]|nr:hypothetical protein C8R44DRAFT_864368 [Mycena epipterygia]